MNTKITLGLLLATTAILLTVVPANAQPTAGIQAVETPWAAIDAAVEADRATTTEAVQPAAVITNGVVSLGVNPHAQLIVPANVAQGLVGVLLNATGNDGVRAGCSCEGWGAGALPGGTQGGANNAFGGPTPNLSVRKFITDGRIAESVTVVMAANAQQNKGALEVTHFYKPSAKTPFLYQVDVTLRNISDVDYRDVRYTRVMDWDVEPTPFADVVTLIGNPARTPGPLRYSDDNGFVRGLPFEPRFPIIPSTANMDFTDLGPFDHGAVLDFSFTGDDLGPNGVLQPGSSKKITVFYGAAPTEAAALRALRAEGLEVFTFGQPAGGGQTGAPNTFIFGYEDDDGREGDSGPADDPTGENG